MMGSQRSYGNQIGEGVVAASGLGGAGVGD